MKKLARVLPLFISFIVASADARAFGTGDKVLYMSTPDTLPQVVEILSADTSGNEHLYRIREQDGREIQVLEATLSSVPSGQGSSPQIAPHEGALSSLLIKELSPLAHLLGYDFDAYHWLNWDRYWKEGEKQLSNPNSDPRVKDHLIDQSAKYFTSLETARQEVGGLYLAVDPLASADYGWGKSEPLLFRVSLHRNLKVLDLHEVRIIPLELQKKLIQAGCDPKVFDISPSQFSYNSLFQGTYGKACGAVITTVLNALQIDLIRYEYTAFPVPGCSDVEFDGAAYILIRSEKAKNMSTQLFWKGTSDCSPEGIEKHNIAFLMDSMLRGKPSYTKETAFWPDLYGSPAPADFESWKKSHVRNCQSPIRSKI